MALGYKKVFAILLTFVMLFSLAGASFAEEESSVAELQNTELSLGAEEVLPVESEMPATPADESADEGIREEDEEESNLFVTEQEETSSYDADMDIIAVTDEAEEDCEICVPESSEDPDEESAGADEITANEDEADRGEDGTEDISADHAAIIIPRELPDEKDCTDAVVLKDTVLYSVTDGEMVGRALAGDVLKVAEIGKVYSLVLYDECEEGAAYVSNSSIALYYSNPDIVPCEETELRYITVSTNMTERKTCREGDLIVIRAVLHGFENDTYTLQWQYSPDHGVTVYDLNGENDIEYAYFLTEENYGYMYRVAVYYNADDEGADLTDEYEENLPQTLEVPAEPAENAGESL